MKVSSLYIWKYALAISQYIHGVRLIAHVTGP
jgi:hypothetical protein